MESNSVCCLCRHIPAKYFCICSSSLLTFCGNCEDKHKTQPGFHYLLPLHCRDNIRLERLHILKSWLEHINIAQRAHIESLRDFDKCEDELNLIFKELVKLLEKQRSCNRQILQGLKNQVSQEITAAVNETQANCMNEEYKPTTRFAINIWQLAKHRIHAPRITLLSYEINLNQDILPACVQFEAKVNEQASDWLGPMEQQTYPAWSVRTGLEMEMNRSGLLDISGISQVAQDTEETQRALERRFTDPNIESLPIRLSSQTTDPVSVPQEQNWYCATCGDGPYPEDATICNNCKVPKREQVEALLYSPYSSSSSPHMPDLSLREQFQSSAPTYPPAVDSSPEEASEELQGGKQSIPPFNCRAGMREMQKTIRPPK